eukprot:m.125384 g.125384  ORF g.125384 m.125384 type:complete len:424 (-) comp16651_c0_seq5:190-1461(-)
MFGKNTRADHRSCVQNVLFVCWSLRQNTEMAATIASALLRMRAGSLARSARPALASTSLRTASTKAVVLEKVKEISLRDIDIEEPFTDRDVRIDIKSVGICGSDVHYYQHGDLGPFKLRQPMVLGHEASGVVTEVGAAVTEFKVGDRVCMEPGVPDPTSRESRMGMYNVCRKLRFWATPPYAENLLDDPAWAAGHGCLRPSVVHPADYTFKIPDHISFDEGAMVEPLAVGMQASKKARITPGDTALVIGAGPIGMMTALAALGSGCSRVLIADISPAKLAVAESLVEPGKIKGLDALHALHEHVLDETEGWGADIVFECSGSHLAAAVTPGYACPGGVVVFVGCPSHPVPLEVGDMQVRELRTESIFRYAHVYKNCVALLASGAIDVKPIITNVFSFDESVKAFDFMCEPPDETIKSIIRVSE